MKQLLLPLVALLILLGVGCGSQQDSDALVLDAIRYHLASRTDLSMGKMEVKLERVEYSGARATAAVTIMARDDAKARMQMVYELKRAGSGWEVDPAFSRSSGSAHGGGPTPMPDSNPNLPPGHPPMGGEQGAERSPLPGGHPPVEGEKPKKTTPELPEGHPPVSAP